MDRRQLLKVAGLAGLSATGAVACGGGTSSGGLTVWSCYDNRSASALNRVFERYRRATGVTVKHRAIAAADFPRTLRRAASAAELPDIALINARDTGTFAKAGILTDLTERITEWGQEDQYYPGSLATTTYRGKRYGLPHVCDCYVLWYNTELVEVPPQTWDEVAATAKKLSTGGRHGLALSAANGAEGASAWVARFLAAGGKLSTVDGEAGRAALGEWVDLVKSGAMSRDVLTMTEQDVTEQFAEGKAAMVLSSAANVTRVRKDKPDLAFEVARIPQDATSTTYLTQDTFTITTGAEDPDAAWELLTYLQKIPVLKRYLGDRGRDALPARRDVAAHRPWSEDTVWQVFIDQLNDAAAPTGKASLASTTILTSVQQAIAAAVSGEKSVAAALGEAQRAIDKALGA